MKTIKTYSELTREEINELKTIMLFDDINEFYECIDEISDRDVFSRFGQMTFRTEDFSCNHVDEDQHEPYAA